MEWRMAIWWFLVTVIVANTSANSSTDIQSGTDASENDQSSAENVQSAASINSLYMIPDFLDVENIPIQSDASGFDDSEFHNFAGKFLIIPEDEEANILENSFDSKHRVEDPHSRSKVSYTSDGTKVIQSPPNEKPSDTSTANEGSASASSPGTVNSTDKSSEYSNDPLKQGLQVSFAPDGTKIIQHAPTALPPGKFTSTPPPGPKPTLSIHHGIVYPKPNTTKTIYYLKDGTRITQFNTGITDNNGTLKPKWAFLPDEYVPGFSDDDGQPNAAGYKYRNRAGEQEKGKLIKEQIDEATKESNPSYQYKSEENMASSLETGLGNSSRSKLPEKELSDGSAEDKKIAGNTPNVAHTVLYDVRPLKPHNYKPFSGNHEAEAGSKRGEGRNAEKKEDGVKGKDRKRGKKKWKKKHRGKLKKIASARLNIMPEPAMRNRTEINANNTEADYRLALRSLVFKNEPGIVQKKQNFAYVSQCGLYTEPQNVSQVQHAWATKTYAPYFYLYEKPKNYDQCKPSPWLNGTDMRGNVFISFEVKSIHGSNMENNAKICQKYCCKEPRCAAWVMRKQSAATANCPKDSFCCWLKTAVPKREPNEDATSGIIQRERYRHPPTGMRSAVPLGGLGTGSFELRADGTFHEWTIENQSPGGAAKLSKTALDLMLLGIRIEQDGNHKSVVLRTHAPHGFDGVDKMAYSGSYPVSKLDVELPQFKDIKMSLYAHSSLKPRDPRLSSVPAVTFSLNIDNPTEEEAVVSFMLNLPLGYNDDTIRRGSNYAEVAFTRLVTAADCMDACAKQSKCMSWTTNGPFSCLLKDSMPLNSYEFGIISGLKGRWVADKHTLTFKRPGFYAQSGEISLRVLGTETDEIHFVTTNHPEKMWKLFKKYGHFKNNTVNATALHGTAAIKVRVPAGKSRTLSIIMTWYYPNRDIADERVGNYYSKIFKSSEDVASYVQSHLTEQVHDVVKFQSSVVPPKSLFPKDTKRNMTCEPTVHGINMLPECLQDILMNSLSFWRSGMWFENGRWRQWEAFDCVNFDPVHVDFHRFLPYVIFYPELAKNVMRSWADHQLIDGMIQESLSQGCLEDTSRDGVGGGRTMTDVNVAFVVQTYMIYMWTNDTEFFDDMYPVAIRALTWLIKDAARGTDLPYRRPDTYDLFELDKYDHCAYNSILTKLALRAGEEMAILKNDFAQLDEIGKAFDRAHVRFEIEMWDDKDGFYHAWFDAEWGSPSWIMSDSFYGQVWAYTLGLGDLVDRKKLKSHLLKERERNDTPFGLKAISKRESDKITQEDTSIILGEEPGCKSLENITKYESIWMTASTDWSALMLNLDMPPKIALHQAEKSLDHYRSTLKDQWNFHGLTSSEHYGLDGLPWATSHYSFHLMLWHLPFALSGQQYNAPNATLTFQPKFEVPFWLSFYTPVALGNIEAKYSEDKSETVFKFTVTSGNIRLRHLSISGSKYGKGEFQVLEGESVQWSTPSKKNDSEKEVKELLSELKR